MDDGNSVVGIIIFSSILLGSALWLVKKVIDI